MQFHADIRLQCSVHLVSVVSRGILNTRILLLLLLLQAVLYVFRAPAIRKMVIGGRKVAQISFIPSCRGDHWELENQCLVSFKSCKSVEIMGCILLHMTFCNVILENEVVHTKLVISLLLLILHH